ncbi:MAG: phytanoyl-CoA dioxygenase family protein [Planctomycetota bacterium]|nr:phytanoyl-CoA dioxygenase family protein [Planctomycetota bacterium]MDA1213064.1 phytanoyl-CoA dioxygenase family protein [Planctomycetota bacterium]
MHLCPDQLSAYHRDGFVVIDDLLEPADVQLLSRVARADRNRVEAAASRADGEGGSIRLSVENELGDDIYSAIVHSEPLVGAMEQVLDGEVYHYHHKMIYKDPRTGGAWAWHQDYGYWYHNGCLFPQLASCLIAIDKATTSNGCLQVLKGSHRLGRVDHKQVGDQTGADPERVQIALDRLELVHVELEPGSAVLFHCNLLHRSDQNQSDDPRWAFICCYNAASNDPYKESRHPRYSHLETWPYERIREVGQKQLAKLQAASMAAQ